MRKPKKTQAAAVEEELLGSLDDCDWHKFWGWACNPADPNTPVWLSVVVDDEPAIPVLANRQRPDLAAAGFGRGWVGFHLHFARKLDPRKPHSVSVMRASDGKHVPNSPWLLPAAAAGGPDARREVETLIGAEIEATRSSVELRPMTEFMVRQVDRLLQAAADSDNGRTARALFKTRWAETLGGTPLEIETPDLRPLALLMTGELPEAGFGRTLIKALQALNMQVAVVAVNGMPSSGLAAESLAKADVLVMGAPLYFTVEDVLARNAGLFKAVILEGPVLTAAYAVVSRLHQRGARVLSWIENGNLDPKLVMSAQLLSDGVITSEPAVAAALEQRVRGMPIVTINPKGKVAKQAEALSSMINPPKPQPAVVAAAIGGG